MPFTFEDPQHEKFPLERTNASQEGGHLPLAIRDALSPAARVTALQFDNLLGSAPADLARISDAIRSSPGLEDLIIRFVALFPVSPGDSVGSIEEAIIVLGTDRLRVLVSIWLLIQERGKIEEEEPKSDASPCGVGPSVTPAAPNSKWTPEMPDLTRLIPLLGLNLTTASANSTEEDMLDSQYQKDRIQGLVDIFGASFISLIPFRKSTLQGSVPRLAPINIGKARRGDPA